MRSFDERWRRLVREARAAEPAWPPAPIHRTKAWLDAARATAARDAGAGAGRGAGASGDLWFRYGLRGLATAAVVLLASVWFALAGTGGERESGSLRPGIENAVAEVFWLL